MTLSTLHMVLYRSSECWGYTEFEQTWKYMNTQCSISCHPKKALGNKFDPVIKMVKVTQSYHLKEMVVVKYDAVYRVSRTSTSWFRKREDFWRSLPYMRMAMWPEQFEQIFIPHIPWRLHMKFGFNRPGGFFGKESENVDSEWPWTTVNEWPQHWVVTNCQVFIYLTISTNFHLKEFISLCYMYDPT